ncbi:MAG: hypothetical protein V4687_15995 [Bacteroidota bacterium]
MKITSYIEQIIIALHKWVESLDPHKVANEVVWYGGIQFHVVMLHFHKVIDWAWSVFTIIFVPLLVWLCLFFFKIWVKFLVAKYLPGLKKYFKHKDESDD